MRSVPWKLPPYEVPERGFRMGSLHVFGGETNETFYYQCNRSLRDGSCLIG